MIKNQFQILPKEVQEQLLMTNDRNSTIYNRKQVEDPLVKRAVEDLIKKKMFQANTAQ